MMFADGRAENFKGNLEDKQVSGPPYPEKISVLQHFIFQVQEIQNQNHPWPQIKEFEHYRKP